MEQPNGIIEGRAEDRVDQLKTWEDGQWAHADAVVRTDCLYSKAMYMTGRAGAVNEETRVV